MLGSRHLGWPARISTLCIAIAASMVFAPNAGTTPDTITGTTIVATAGTPFSGVIATTDLPPGELSVNWGDGITSSGTIAADGSVTGTNTYASEGSFDITLTSGPTTGNSTAIVLSSAQGAALTGSDTTTVSDGGTGTASVLPPGPGITATLQQPTGSATLFVAVYGTNPESAPIVAGGFYDVRVVGGGPTATVQIAFHYVGISGVPRLQFFSPDTGTYQLVQSPSIVVDQAAQTITVTLDNTTSPAINQLTKTVFAAASPEVRFTG